MPYHSIELVEVVQALAQQIAGLRADLRQFGIRATGGDATLIEAAHEAMGDRTFLACDLLAAGLSTDAAGARLAVLLSGKSIRSIGKTLARAANKRTETGLVLRHVGESGAGLLWHVGV